MQYKVKIPNSTKIRDVNIPFVPYTNIFASQNGTLTGLVTQDVTLALNTHIVVVNGHSVEARLNAWKTEGYFTVTLPVTPNKKYLISVYVLNDGVTSTGLQVGTASAWHSNFYLRRLGVVVDSESNTELSVKITAMHPCSFERIFTIDGWFATEISDEEYATDVDTLLDKYQYVTTTKLSPTLAEVLQHMYHFSPYMYYVTHNGGRIIQYQEQLISLGVQENDTLETYTQEVSEQIFQTLINCKDIMVLLSRDVGRVSHAFPSVSITEMEASHFPRIQYYGGFEVSVLRADGKSLANNTNMALNVYIPTHKMRNSLNDEILSSLITRELSTIGFSAIRGSDYQLQEQKLYVRQTQYVKDVHTKQKQNT